MRFSPTISEEDVRREAARVMNRTAEARAKVQYEEALLLREKELQEQAQVSQVDKAAQFCPVVTSFWKQK